MIHAGLGGPPRISCQTETHFSQLMARRPELDLSALALGSFPDPWPMDGVNMHYPFLKQYAKSTADPSTMPIGFPVASSDIPFLGAYENMSANSSSHGSTHSFDTISDYGFPGAHSSVSSSLSSPTGASSVMADSYSSSASTLYANSNTFPGLRSQPCLEVHPTATHSLALPQPSLSYVEDCCASTSSAATIVPTSTTGNSPCSATSSSPNNDFFATRLPAHAEKRHRCGVCGKRFARPSSLKTHSYCHSGEKPFICDHPGCGRQFSVVSNLRRHRKVHMSHESLPVVALDFPFRSLCPS